MIMKNMNVKILKRNLIDIYMNYKKINGDRLKDYKEECFNQMNEEPKSEDDDYCIIETGFNIFFLIAQYVEYKGDIHFTDVIQEKDSGVISNSLLGSIFMFFKSIVVAIFEILDDRWQDIKKAQ